MRGWSIANASLAAGGVRVFVDLKVVYDGAPDRPRPDVQQAFPGAALNTGFDVTIPAAPGTHSICVWAVDPSNGSISPLFIRDVTVTPAPPPPPPPPPPTTIPPTTTPAAARAPAATAPTTTAPTTTAPTTTAPTTTTTPPGPAAAT